MNSGIRPAAASALPYVFGTTVVSSSGFQGKIYHLKDGTEGLPNFGDMKPLGTIYTDTLNVWPQQFSQGFPGVTGRNR